ncbi:hypothetical protein UFOVP1236_39 [uncultured Caudovirales phage]|uniref:Uncharacterized protein n=1 Tax=uncultured Caudovirales phage TaxID=2100421 RepID=A0A6J5RDC1_9CAUD|nr:hypothetical protein UFOVP1236_39 [uncultured Caudovirales phage]
MTAVLGPGDDDPRSPAGAGATIAAALGAGDDDPRSPAVGQPEAQRGPLAAGEASGPNPDDDFDFLTPGPSAAGDIARGPRSVVRIPKRG